MRDSLKSFQEQEERRLYGIFLSACLNFNSNKENLKLLFYGFIHFEINDINLYRVTPSDVIEAIIIFTYDSRTIQKAIIQDSFDVELRGYYKIDTNNPGLCQISL